MSDQGGSRWKWSVAHQDYYRYQRRVVAGKSEWDLVWGRAEGVLPAPPENYNGPSSAPTPSVTNPHNHHDQRTAPPPSLPPSLPPSSAGNPGYVHVLPGQELAPLDLRQPALSSQGIQARYPVDVTGPLRDAHNSSPMSGIYVLRGPIMPYSPYGPNTSTDGGATSTFDTPTPTSGTNAPHSHGHPDTDPLSEHLIDQLAGDVEYDGAPQEPEGLTSSPGFVRVTNPRGFFRKGKVFKVNWVEPLGEGNMTTTSSDALPPATPYEQAQETTSTPDLTLKALSILDGPTDTDTLSVISKSHLPEVSTSSNQTFHAKTRIFVVIRTKGKHCLCLPIYTYSLKATSKHSANAEEHAPVVQEGKRVAYHQDEQINKLKKPLTLIIEDQSVQWNSLSRLNFTKVQTVEYNLKVQKVGRIQPDSLIDLEAMFREGVGLN